MQTTTDRQPLDAFDLSSLPLTDVIATLDQVDDGHPVAEVLRRLFNRDSRELLTYSAFGSAL